LQERDRQQRAIDDRRALIERADQREEVQAFRRAVPVRQRHRQHRNPLLGQDGAQLVDPLGVGAVALPDRQRLRVEPEGIAPLEGAGRGDASGDRDAELAEGRFQYRDLALAQRLPRPAEDRARIGDDDRIVREDAVLQGRVVQFTDQHLRPRVGEEIAEPCVLRDGALLIERAQVAERLPGRRAVRGDRRVDEDAPQRCDVGVTAVGS